MTAPPLLGPQDRLPAHERRRLEHPRDVAVADDADGNPIPASLQLRSASRGTRRLSRVWGTGACTRRRREVADPDPLGAARRPNRRELRYAGEWGSERPRREFGAA